MSTTDSVKEIKIGNVVSIKDCLGDKHIGVVYNIEEDLCEVVWFDGEISSDDFINDLQFEGDNLNSFLSNRDGY